MEFELGQILNFKYYDNFFGKAIRYYNRKVYGEDGFTHSAIITGVNADWLEIGEALGHFTVSNYERWWVEGKIKEGVISVGTATKQPLNNVKYYADKYIGIGYGWWAVILIFIFGKYLSKISDGVKSLICSEAIARILYDASDEKMDFEPEFKKSYDMITPEDLFRSKQIKWN